MTMASSLIGAKKLGQPEPDSYFVCELNNGCPQHTQLYVPARLSLLYLPVPARSVPLRRQIWNCSGVSSCIHCCSDLTILSTMLFLLSVPAIGPRISRRILLFSSFLAKSIEKADAIFIDALGASGIVGDWRSCTHTLCDRPKRAYTPSLISNVPGRGNLGKFQKLGNVLKISVFRPIQPEITPAKDKCCISVTLHSSFGARPTHFLADAKLNRLLRNSVVTNSSQNS